MKAVLPFVGLALHICNEMEMFDKDGQGIVMRFAKLYSPEKLANIIHTAQGFSWWRSNPKAAFMKAIGIVNKEEKNQV